MGFTQIKRKLQSENGFTIVELLIVIVVIGILAAITIVAYNGVTTRANATKAQTNAATIQKVAEAYAADPTINTGLYPATAAALTAYSGTTRVPAGITVLATTTPCATTSTTATCLAATGTYIGTSNVIYIPNSGATGACIGWYNYQTSTTNWVYAGASPSTSNPSGTTALVCS